MSHTAIFVALCTFFSTTLGGIFVVRFRDRLHLIMGFTAGILLGVVFFDIFPEIIEQIGQTGIPSVYAMIAVVAGFLLFHILEKTILIHHNHEADYAVHHHPHVGVASALALIGHSFMDGVGIGLGFQASTTIGIAIAIAVICHDFTDGMNTVMLMLLNKNTPTKSKLFLIADAAAPVIGVFSTFFFVVPATFLVLYLGFFAGFLLYIGASDILPEAHSEKSSLGVIGLTILGTICMFGVTRFV